MQIAAKRNLLLTTSSSFNEIGEIYHIAEQGRLYQQIAYALIQGGYKKRLVDIGDELIAIAEHALALRQADVVERISEILMNSPLPSGYHNIGQYYRALSVKRRYGVAAARIILESVATSAATPLRYRARALHAIGAHYFYIGNTREALRFFLEAGRAASQKHGSDLLTATLSPWMIAVIKSVNGDHNGAMSDLGKVFPFVRLLMPDQPFVYYSYANSLAIEYGEVGRIEEAHNASRIALAFPFADRYPEFSQTANDISQKTRCASRSVVAISRKEFQIEDDTDEETSNEQTSVTIRESADESGNKLLLFRRRAFNPQQPPLYSQLEANSNQLTLAQKRSRIIDIAYSLAEDALDRLLELANELDDQPAQSRRPREINLEERGTLEMMMSLWTTGDLRLEDQVAVLSSLRDCDDGLRRNNIINSMISYMFRFTQERMESEHFWRKRFEAILTPEED